MPKSKVRRKNAYTAPQPDKRSPAMVKATTPSSPVYIGVMLGLFVVGLAWLVVNYLAQDKIPLMSVLGPWNFAVGFVLIVVGLGMTTRWR